MKARKNKVALIAVLSTALLASSCRGGFLFDIWDEFQTLFLDVSPSAATLEPGQELTMKAEGGQGPYVFTKTAGDGTLTDNLDGTADYTAPGAATDAEITLTDSRGEKVLANIQVSAAPIEPLLIVPASVSLVWGESFDFDADGGVGLYVFSLDSGSGIIDPVSGVFTALAQDTDAVVLVEDQSGQAAQALVTVRAAPQPLAIAPATLTIEVNSKSQFSATGGVPPYTYSTTGGSITAAGLLTAPAAPASITVTVTDSVPATASTAVTVVELWSALKIIPSSVKVKVGQKYQFKATGGSGGYSYSMGINYGGTVTPAGRYTAPKKKTGTEYVIVRDSRGITAKATVKVKK